jgi:hypothetical protein
MSSFPPPNVYFNGIIYDSQFFEIPALTLSEANAKYLRKTIPDTATALETFNNGIRVNDISATAVSSAQTLFNNTTTGNMQIGQAQTTGTISIGNGSNRNGTIGIGQNTKGNVSIANNMLGGSNVVTIGTNSLGTVNLKGATVKINETGSTGATEIGNASSGAITIFKPLTPNYTYPVSSPSQIGWTQSVETGFRQPDLRSCSAR